MTDFVVGSTLTADASQFTATMEGAERSLEEVGQAARDAGQASGGLTTGSKQAEAATNALGNAARKTREEITAEAGAKRAAAAEAKAAAQAEKALADAKAKLQQEARRSQVALQNVGRQISDVQVQAIAGTNGFLIFGQQAGQLADALSQTEGRLKGLGTFLAGPWGSVVIGAITVVGLLATGLIGAGDAADKKKEAIERLKKAEEDLNNASAAVTRSAYTEANAHLAAARAAAEREIKTRNLIAAQLQQAREEVRISSIRAQAPGQRGELAALTLDVNTSRAGALDTALAKATAEASQAAARARRLEVPVAQLQAAAATDKAVAATQKYERAIGRLTAQRQAGKISQDELNAAVLRETVARDKAVEAAGKHGSASTSVANAQAKLAAADTDVEKAAARLALTRAQATAELKAGSITQAEYTQRVAAAQNALDGARDAAKGHAAATRDAARAEKELESALASVQSRFDPAAAAARRYTETLKEIERLRASGKISQTDADVYSRGAAAERIDAEQDAWDRQVRETAKRIGGAFESAMDKPLIDSKTVGENIKRDFGLAGDKIRDAGESMADAIERVIGGKAGGALGSIFRVLEGRPGQNGILGFPVSAPGAPGKGPLGLLGTGTAQGGFLEGLQQAQSKFETGINKVFGDVFGQRGLFGQTLSQNLGQAFGGAQIGGQFGKPITNLLGLKGSNTGAQIGGAIGSFIPIPGGEIIGSIIGSALGGVLKSTPRASATITSVNDKAAVAGNSAALREAASGLATSVQGGLQQIADALGGSLGSFAVSIGTRDGKFRVDPSGRGVTKTRKGAIDFGKDEGSAIAFAIQDAIIDGAVTGLSAAVQQALKSSPNLDKALKEALSVQEVEQIVQGINGAFRSELAAFEKQAADRLRIARQYGFDVVAIEKRNAEDRKAIIDNEINSRVGGLQQFRDSLTSGDLFEGSEVDRRNTLFGRLAGLQEAVQAGKEGAGNDLAQALSDFVQSSRSAFGTAGPEYQADRAKADEIARQTIEMERKRIEDAAAAAAQTNQQLATANGLLNESNNKQAQILAELKRLNLGTLAGVAFGGGSPFVNPNIAAV